MQNVNTVQMSLVDNMKKVQALVNAGKIDTRVGTALLNQMLVDSLKQNSQSGANFPQNLNQTKYRNKMPKHFKMLKRKFNKILWGLLNC